MLKNKAILSFGFKISLLLCFLFTPVLSFCQDKKVLPVTIDSDEINYMREEGRVSAKGRVKIKKDNITLYCDEIDYDVNANIAHLKGNVKITKETTSMYGSEIIYDFENETVHAVNLRMESEPIYGEGQLGDKTQKKEEYIIQRGYVSTCNLKKPHYRFQAKRIIIYPKIKVIAKHVIFKVGEAPLFYWPYLYMPLNKKMPDIRVGESKEWGLYALSSWRYHLNDFNDGKYHIDKYEDRGWGLGFTHKLENKNLGKALVTYYNVEDKLYQLSKRNSLFELYPDRESLSPKYLEDDRYRAQYAYEWNNDEDALSIKSEFNKYSDEYFLKDFFYREYEKGYGTNFYTLATKSFQNASLSLLYQDRVNNFYNDTTYLPQLEYNLFTQKISDGPFYIESNNKLGNLEKVYSRSSQEQTAFRFHSYNSLSLPTKIKWLYLNPKGGYYTTFYSKTVYEEDSLWRITPHTGMDLSTKFFKYFGTKFDLFDKKISGLRHVVTPSLSYSYVRPPKVYSSKLFQFDGTDSLDRTESVVFTLDNKLQGKGYLKTGAKDEIQKWDLVYFSPAVTYLINKEGRGSHFSSVSGDLEIYPADFLSLKADNNYDPHTRRITEANVDFNIRHPKKKNSISLGQRYTRQDSTQGTMTLEYELTSKIFFRNYMRYEYNTRDLKEQEYALRFDLHCWWFDIALTKRLKDFGEGRNEYADIGIMAIFTLKAFPELYGGFERTYNGTKRAY